MKPFPNNDIATEILSRLPAESLVAFKCTSKRCYNFVCDPSFLRIHDKRVKGTRGLIVQDMLYEPKVDIKFVNLLTLTETEHTWKNNVLDFLPEEVVLISSSNGILCCHSLDYSSHWNFVIYICNAVTREWLQVRTKRPYYFTEIYIGLAVYPFSSSSRAASMFKLVILNYPRENPDTYLFDIYSSDTKKWKTSKEVCAFRSPICSSSKIIFINGWLHYLTLESQIIAFHVENELSKVIPLPFLLGQDTSPSCLGESESYLHYVYYNRKDLLQVWVLKNYKEPAWELKHSLNITEFRQQHSSVLPPFTDEVLKPVAFYDDVLYIRITSGDAWVISYNFRTKRMINMCSIPRSDRRLYNDVPHCVSLVPLDESYSIKDGRRKRNRKRKFLKE